MYKWFFFFFFLPLALAAQEFPSPRLDSLFDGLEENQKLSGSIALAKDGKLLYQRSFGWARYGTGDTVANSAETHFRIGSISKVFTAVMILQEVAEGKLKLDQTLSDFFPQIPQADSISIRMLLKHRSGIANLTEQASYYSYMTQAMSQDTMLRIIEGFEREFRPNDHYVYSNTNYILLGYILEELTQKSYAHLFQERIAAPLDLQDSYVGKSLAEDDEVAFSYQRTNTQYIPSAVTHLSIPGAAGAVVSTPADLLHFSHALFNGRLLPPEYVQMMRPDPTEQYGVGLMWIEQEDSLIALGHGGAIDGFNALLAHYTFPQDFAIALCTNAGTFRMNKVVELVAQDFLGHAYAIPPLTKFQLSSGQLEAVIGTYQSDNFPLDIRLYNEAGQLKAQATGQPALALEARSPTYFVFEPADIQLFLDLEAQSLRLEQYGQKIEFVRKTEE